MLGCKGSSGNRQWMKTLDSETLAAAKAWKADRMGCNRIRVVPLAETLSPRLKDAQLKEAQIAELLGDPEMRHVGEEHTILSYYFDGECGEDGKLKDGTVYCLLQFFLGNKSKIIEMSSVVCG